MEKSNLNSYQKRLLTIQKSKKKSATSKKSKKFSTSGKKSNSRTQKSLLLRKNFNLKIDDETLTSISNVLNQSKFQTTKSHKKVRYTPNRTPKGFRKSAVSAFNLKNLGQFQTMKQKSPRMESMMFSKKADLSTLMSSIMNKSKSKTKSKAVKGRKKSSKSKIKMKSSTSKGRHKRTQSGYLNMSKISPSDSKKKNKATIVGKHQRRSRDPSQNSTYYQVPVSISGQILDKEPRVTHYNNSFEADQDSKIRLGQALEAPSSSNRSKVVKYSIVGQQQRKEIFFGNSQTLNSSSNRSRLKYLSKSFEKDQHNPETSRNIQQLNLPKYHLKSTNIASLDIPEQLSSIRHHQQSKTFDTEILNLNNLERRLELERAKFLSIIQSKDLQIQKLQDELDATKEREIKYKMMLADQNKKQKGYNDYNEKVEFSSGESDDMQNISF